ncbi:hypothetical protein JTY81_10375 [Citrobacter freundii]|jgi:hypothetical protein|uniref:Uncharacterized protein n=1 Tax=Citrobacter freundii TaxID=546 RepID=A0AAN4EVZ6_CITFR|nr:hypothetical protein [Citrobacter freundii]EKW2110866.1 hypothetical protein [Citrobacter freundii]MBM7187724.1 hypothetical protein [Citrobacter freundii]MBM7251159.1 hypothetical protein [Citrobacter freundii]MBM7289310.1 hypothetical protein [Citrobacter freundii]
MTDSVVVVYSPEWVIESALRNFYTGKNKVGVKATDNIEELLLLISDKQVTSVILHVPERNYVRLICAIRHRQPTLPVIVAQRRILFSDMAVARWFGNIWLKDFDSLMAKFNEKIIIDSCISDSRFAGVESASACFKYCTGKPGSSRMLKDSQRWLGILLRERVGSRQGAKIVSEWLSRGLSVEDVSKKLGCSKKVIHHYRRMTIKSLGIHHDERDFLPSVSLHDGPLSGDLYGKCKMRDVENGN